MADVENSDYINAVFVHVSIPRIFYAAGTGDKERSAFFIRKQLIVAVCQLIG